MGAAPFLLVLLGLSVVPAFFVGSALARRGHRLAGLAVALAPALLLVTFAAMAKVHDLRDGRRERRTQDLLGQVLTGLPASMERSSADRWVCPPTPGVEARPVRVAASASGQPFGGDPSDDDLTTLRAALERAGFEVAAEAAPLDTGEPATDEDGRQVAHGLADLRGRRGAALARVSVQSGGRVDVTIWIDCPAP